MGSFEFVVVLTIIVKVLDFLKGSTKKIQGRALDLYDVVGQVQLVRSNLMFERDYGDFAFFKHCVAYANNVAALFGEEGSIPRTAARQHHRANAEANTPFEYWLRNVHLPFLYHIIVRFDKYGAIIHRMAGLVPTVAAQRDNVP